MNLNSLWPQFQQKEPTVANNFIYTDEQLMARLKFFIGICLALTLTGIVFVVLYSIIFVTQPLNAISPIDQKFFELIIPIATFLTGTLSGIMLAGGSKEEMDMKRDMLKQAQEAAQAYSKANPLKIEPAFSPGISTTPGFNGTSQPEIIYINGKPAPQPAPQPEL
jgi:membrane-associated protease RseP (regulator of RpoE activity)